MADDVQELAEAREVLLDHYTTQLTSHYNYFWIMLSAVVGFIGIREYFRPAVYLALRINISSWVFGWTFTVDVFIFVLSWFLAAASWVFVKCLFYGACCRSVLDIPPSPKGQTMLRKLDSAVVGRNQLMKIVGSPYLFILAVPILWLAFYEMLGCMVSSGLLVFVPQPAGPIPA